MWWPQQNVMISERKTSADEMCFQTFLQGQRFYSCLPDKDEFAKFILSDESGSTFCNELLWSDTYGYLDLDCPYTLQEMGFSSENTFITAFSNILISSHKELLGVELRPSDILWSCSTRPNKTSYHIKIAAPYFWKVEDRALMKEFFRHINQICLETEGFHFFGNDNKKVKKFSILDLSVYSTNRCFRAVGCSKPDSDVKFTPIGGRITHSSVVQNFLTVTPSERLRLQPYLYKSRKADTPKLEFSTNILEQLAGKYDSKVVKLEGNLVILANTGCRICPISNEENHSDNAFFIIKSDGIFLGCHNDDCKGKHLKIYEFDLQKTYTFYDDYKKLLSSEKTKQEDIVQYMKETICFIDRPSEPLFAVRSKCGVSAFHNKIHTIQTNTAKTLFKGYQDIVVYEEKTEEEPEPKPMKFSKILSNLLLLRKIPTYTDTIWKPYLQKNPVSDVSGTKLNLFTGFALEQIPSSNIDFTKTQIFDLLQRLAGSPECHEYLLHFIAYKLQYPWDKKPIALAFINSKEGVGKGSLGVFLERLFSCDSNSYVSFNSIDSFSNSFNGIQSRALFCCLEEITAKKGGLRQLMGLLKDKISSTTIMEEIKNRERVLRQWYASIIIFSNDFNIMSVSKNDRRMCFMESNSTLANNKEYFQLLYKELADLEIMKAAFDFFSNRDTSEWNYRKIPYTETKARLVTCSERNSTKFHRYFLQQLHGKIMYTFTAERLYDYYRSFVEEYGMNKKYDRTYVTTQFELYLHMSATGSNYVLTEQQRVEKLNSL